MTSGSSSCRYNLRAAFVVSEKAAVSTRAVSDVTVFTVYCVAAPSNRSSVPSRTSVVYFVPAPATFTDPLVTEEVPRVSVSATGSSHLIWTRSVDESHVSTFVGAAGDVLSLGRPPAVHDDQSPLLPKIS